MTYTPVACSLRVASSALAGGCACGPAEPVPRPILAFLTCTAFDAVLHVEFAYV